MDRKEYSLDQKSEVSKSSEKSSFSKGLVHVFIKNSSSLPCWFFRQRRQKDRFLIFWIEKDTFLSSKVKFQKRPKNQIF